MKIKLNGKPLTLSAPLSIADFLLQQNYGDMKVAVAINAEFSPKSTHSKTMLQDGDEIEIVAPMQGG